MASNEHKLRTATKSDIRAAARQALMLANPDYFSLSEQEQEIFRATKSDIEKQKINCVLLDSLLNIKCGLHDVYEAWERIPVQELTPLNWASQLTKGIGDDFIWLNDFMPAGKTLLDFPTAADYSDDLQVWARLLIKDEFYYGWITSIARHVFDEMMTIGSDYIAQLIPNKRVESADHDKEAEGGFLWDMESDAGGLEEPLAELEERWYPYLYQMLLDLKESQVNMAPAIYIRDGEPDEDPHRTFIYTNFDALKQVRWKHFLSDCESIMGDFSMVDEMIEDETKKAKVFLDKQYQEVMANFDPKVVKLRQKKKIVMSSNARNDLNKILDDDTSE